MSKVFGEVLVIIFTEATPDEFEVEVKACETVNGRVPFTVVPLVGDKVNAVFVCNKVIDAPLNGVV